MEEPSLTYLVTQSIFFTMICRTMFTCLHPRTNKEPLLTYSVTQKQMENIDWDVLENSEWPMN